jgi:hypothetical protein
MTLIIENIVLWLAILTSSKIARKERRFLCRDPFRENLEGIIEEWDLLNINPQKGRYTWSNMRFGPGHITDILDRFLIHNSFLSSNSSMKSFVLPSFTSDHKPISLILHNLLEYGPFLSVSILFGSVILKY